MKDFFRGLTPLGWLCSGFFALVLLILFIPSCNPRYPTQPGYINPATPMVAQVAAPAAAPVVVEHDSGMGFFSGMLAGHLLSGGFGHPYGGAPVSNTTVTKNVTIHKHYGEGSQPAPTVAPTTASPSKPLQKPAAPPSFTPPRYSSMGSYRASPRSYGSYRSSFTYRGRR